MPLTLVGELSCFDRRLEGCIMAPTDWHDFHCSAMEAAVSLDTSIVHVIMACNSLQLREATWCISWYNASDFSVLNQPCEGAELLFRFPTEKPYE